MKDKPIYVSFCDKKLENSYDKLKSGAFKDKKLYDLIDKAIMDIKKDSTSGIKIPRKRWPKIYIQKYDITNLWKYDLPDGWRLVYTIKTDEVMILNVILEWFDHKGYEKRFKY